MTDQNDAADGDAQVSVRETARLKASELRSEHRRRDRNRTLIIRGSVALAIIAAAAAVVIVIVSFAQPPARGPRNMQSDGVRIGADLKAERTAPLAADDEPIEAPANPAGVVDIRMYIDYSDPNAAEFMGANGDQIATWLTSGVATFELHPIALPATTANTSHYALRAANAVACVAELSPDSSFAFSQKLLLQTPDPDSDGLDDARLVAIAKSAEVTGLSRVEDCIDEGRFTKWVQAASARAVNGPIPGADIDTISSIPTVIIDGKRFAFADPSDDRELARAFQSASSTDFDESPTPTPTPTPAP